MKIEVDTNSLGIQGKGEALRGLIFDQKIRHTSYGNYPMLGCYETFDLLPGVIEIDPLKYPSIFNIATGGCKTLKEWNEDYGVKLYAVESDKVVCYWWWDGDGDLTVWEKGDKYVLRNTDCKNLDEWRPYEIGKDFPEED